MDESKNLRLSNKEYHGLDSDEIKNLAKSLVIISSNNSLELCISNVNQVLGMNPCDIYNLSPELNPDSDDFNLKFWIKNLRKVYYSDP